ncbi:hypothetical protein [uncultured Muribaculum sp.]|uniref:hypothetical protein n=1 Tax=uncultured Muribaculum sp. TaxID=1918613 RepID=UPI0025D7F78B|nr:hypothetical protein [uncultured Muribaculum sp.]
MEGTPSLDILKGGSLVVGGSAPMPLNHLVIKEDFYSNQFGFGQLLNSSPAMTANSVTLSMYCDGNRWYFISMPCDVKLSNIKNVDDASFVFRYYDGESRAANGTGSSWKDVPVDGTLQAGRAYIYQTDRNSTIEFTLDVTGIEGLLASGHRTVPVNAWTSENPANAGWNLIGNPSLTYFDMASTSLTCPITVWDSYNRRYVAYSLIDDDVVLYPTQAFFMQQIGENGEITFDAKGRQLTSEVSRPAAVAAAGIARRVIFNLELVVAGDASSDRTRIVLNDDASLDYECGRDASKFFADGGEVVEFFTMDGSGNRLAINERPEGDCRVRLGLYAPGASTLTISAPRLDGEAVLHDAVTGRYVDLRKENSYTFDVDSRGFVLDRFSITVRKPTSGIGEITGEDDMKVAVDGNILTVVGVKGLPVIVYALDGRVAAVADSCETHSFTLPAGMYVVKAGKTAVKCIIR